MVKLTIDGQEVEAELGSLLLEVAAKSGAEIPTFCYQKRLTPLASCRMCLVEIEGQPKLAPACVTLVAENMVVRTNTALVSDTRETMLEFLLANHPLDCPVCDKAGECELQDMVFEYGAGVSRFRDEKRVFRSKDLSLNKVIIFNANRCIQCQRCVRMCEDVVGAVALGTIDRGMDSEITGFENSLNSCDHCGNCIEVCPVGALMSEPYRYTSRPWDLVETDTTCGMCGTGCQLTIGVRDGKLARVRSKYETGVNGETLCVKGRFGVDMIDAENRIDTPMIRKEGMLVSVSWEEAIAELKSRFPADIDGTRIGGLASASMTSEVLYLFQKMMRTVFSTNSVDSSNRFSLDRDTAHSSREILIDLVDNFYTRDPLEDTLKSDCIIVVGSGVTESNPVSEYMIRLSQHDASGRLLVASARPSRLDTVAAGYLRVIPGEENVFFAGMEAKLTNGLTGQEAEGVNGFAEKAGHILEKSETVTLLIGSDIFRGPNARNTLRWLETYIVTLKSLGKKIAFQFLFDRANQMGAWEMGVLPDQLPGWHSLDDKKSRDYFEEIWGHDIPKSKGKNTHQILKSCAEKEMDLLYCLHSDPISFFPDREIAIQALENVGTLVVQASHQSATTEMADIVLPSVSFAEESGTFINNEGLVQKLHKIRAPFQNAKNNLDILNFVSSAFGEDIGPLDAGNIYTETERQGTREIPVDWVSQRPELPPNAVRTDQYGEDSTFLLITGESRYHSGGVSMNSKTLHGIENQPYVEMNKDDASQLNVSDGDLVTVRTRKGSIELEARLNKSSAPKTLFVPENFPDYKLNQVLSHGEYPCPAEIVLKDQ